jgi:hypothetical protein
MFLQSILKLTEKEPKYVCMLLCCLFYAPEYQCTGAWFHRKGKSLKTFDITVIAKSVFF